MRRKHDSKQFFPSRVSLKEGFTLVEILITIAVLAFGCFAALMMQSAALRGNVRADNLTVATFIAETEIERLKAMSFEELTNEVNDNPSGVEKKVDRVLKVCSGPEAPQCLNYPFTMKTDFFPRYPTKYSHLAEIKVSWGDDKGRHEIVYSASMTDLAL
ncbi:MAG: type II secretion system GspH family protein [Deltaproteobacteria bacterium]|jgi:prepilin-type N-terminal cleavage/methylation domain-containing protein|nr:type II secretion system GspH family protein [Deltaproteobacteria bacterium]